MSSAKRLSGTSLANTIAAELKATIFSLSQSLGKVKLVTLQLGNEPASSSYRRSLSKTCSQIGLEHKSIRLPCDVNIHQISSTINTLNNDTLVGGIILLTPLPSHVNNSLVADMISPAKDVECVTSARRAALYSGDTTLAPATAAAADCLLRAYDVPISGATVAIIGRSHTVGRPLGLILIDRDATVTICHSKTANLAEITCTCDIVISAAGVPDLVSFRHIKPGAIVLDVGTNYVGDKLTGDVDYEGVAQIAAAISPVPGGIGPLTNLMLVRNLVTLLESNN
tara:strand:- start:3547 stop:4395 length:849 start_codon:yes stop_codon:yes gene_type:complete